MEIETLNMSFKPLLIFPFQYIAEKKLKQEYWKGNQNKKTSRYIDLIYRLFNIMLVPVGRFVSPMGGGGGRNILIYRDIMLLNRD